MLEYLRCRRVVLGGVSIILHGKISGGFEYTSHITLIKERTRVKKWTTRRQAEWISAWILVRGEMW